MTYPPPQPAYYPGPDEEQPPPHWGTPPPPPKKKHSTLIVVAILVVLVLCVVGALVIGGLATSDTSKVKTFTSDGVVPAGSTPPAGKKAPVKAPTKAAPRPVTIGEGEWLVGGDTKAGTYKTNGAREGAILFCTWTVRASDDSGAEILDVGSSSRATETGRVRLKNGQVFDTSGCKDWVRQ